MWDQQTANELQRTGCPNCETNCMVAYDGLLITVYGKEICVWSTATGEWQCDQVLISRTDVSAADYATMAGYLASISCLACSQPAKKSLPTSLQYLASGCRDGTIEVWGIGSGGAGPWPYLGKVSCHTGEVVAMVVWNNRVISISKTSRDGICVNNLLSLELEVRLDVDGHNDDGHDKCSLAAYGGKLFSVGSYSASGRYSDRVGAINVWALGTWERLCNFKVGDHLSKSSQHRGMQRPHWLPACLTISGSKLLCGGYGAEDSECGSNGFLLVFYAATMDCEYSLSGGSAGALSGGPAK